VLRTGRTGRSDPVEPEDVALHLDLPLAGTLREDARVAVDADRARLPGSRSSGALASLVDSLLAVQPEDIRLVERVGA
jgi:hypothetical protein